MLALWSLAGCASLPTTRTTVPSTAITDTTDTTLGRAIPGALAGLNGPTGVRLMQHGPDAFLVTTTSKSASSTRSPTAPGER